MEPRPHRDDVCRCEEHANKLKLQVDEPEQICGQVSASSCARQSRESRHLLYVFEVMCSMLLRLGKCIGINEVMFK